MAKLSFRDRIMRIERTVIYLIRPNIYPKSSLNNYKNPLILVSVQKRNADVTAPESIANTTREYTEALQRVAEFHTMGVSDDVKPHKQALELHLEIHAFLDKHFPLPN